MSPVGVAHGRPTRMLLPMARPDPGSTLLAQGTDGGMSGALISLAGGRTVGMGHCHQSLVAHTGLRDVRPVTRA